MHPSGDTIPVISVIITCFNDGIYLQQAVDSVLKCRKLNWELIIVNDGSTDEETLRVLQLLKDEHFQVIDQPNQGAPAARNTGMKRARAPYILLLDADNYIEPEYLEKGVDILDREPQTGVVYADCYIFGKETGIRRWPEFNFPRMLAGNYVDNCSVFRKQIWEEVGGFETDPGLTAHHDWDFWLSAGAAGWHFHHVGEPLFHYRIREGSITSQASVAENKRRIIGFITRKHLNAYAKNLPEVIGFLNDDIQAILRQQKEEREYHASLDQRVREQEEEIAHQVRYGQTMMEMVHNLEKRLQDIESSRWYKIKAHLVRIRDVFRSKDKEKAGGVKFFGKLTFFITSRGRKIVRHFLTRVFKYLYLWLEDRPVVILVDDQASSKPGQDPYQTWMQKHMPGENDFVRMSADVGRMTSKPLFSIIVPVYNPPPGLFEAMIESVLAQVYPHWELCMADDASTDPEVKQIMENYAAKDSRIKIVFRKVNGHISACSNSALELAQGEFIVLVDQDDLLSRDALYEVALLLEREPSADLVYTDEDKIDENGRHTMPHFKPRWSPDNLLSRNYFGHLVVMRHTIVRSIGGFRLGFEGSQDYDILLRFTEHSRHIFHIPKVLYHWRIHSRSAAGSEAAKPYAYRAAQRALSEALKRRDEPGTVDFLPGFRGYSIRYQIRELKKVSVIIPTKNKASVLETCLKSVFGKTSYPDFEVILVDNRSTEQTLFDLVSQYEKQYPGKFRCLKLDVDFNFSKLMNEAAKVASGDYLLLLNNDTEVIAADWMNAMVEQAQRKSIGAVGAKLLYHNDTIQHAGVIIGLGGAAGHSFVGVHKDGPGYFNYVNSVNNYCAVTAACLMVRKEVYREVGGFDEQFAVEYNDVDFCLKLISAGYYNVYLPHVMLYHYESLTRGHPKSSTESFERHIREIKMFQDRWKKYIDDDPFFSPNLSLGHHDFQIRLN